MPPKATTSTANRRPAPGTGSGRPGPGTARPAGAGPGRPARPATAGPSRPRIPVRGGAGVNGNAKPAVDVKPEVNLGEEEWSKLMKETYGGKQSAEWYAKGAKSVEVSLALGIYLHNSVMQSDNI